MLWFEKGRELGKQLAESEPLFSLGNVSRLLLLQCPDHCRPGPLLSLLIIFEDFWVKFFDGFFYFEEIGCGYSSKSFLFSSFNYYHDLFLIHALVAYSCWSYQLHVLSEFSLLLGSLMHLIVDCNDYVGIWLKRHLRRWDDYLISRSLWLAREWGLGIGWSEGN